MKAALSFRTLVATVALLACQAAVAQPVRKPLPMHHPVEDKDFYLFSLLESDPGLRSALAGDKELAQVALERQSAVSLGLRTCKGDAVCTVKTFIWTDEEIRMVSLALARLSEDNAPLQAMIDRKLRPSGAYVLYENQPAGELLANAWADCARGLNDVIAVYGEGLPPRYPLIDSISIDLKSAQIQQRVSSLATQVSGSGSAQELFFEPSLTIALQLLTWNHRDEAGRFEPMETGVNEAAVKSIPATRWQDDPYTAIVVPGAGPGNPNVALSEAGRRRCALAAAAYQQHKAPFILVSGGYVHPSQTRFSEAIEMKKALIEEFHVPESAIIVDPHARHTTTNLRNAAREIYRYKMPFNKAALIVSDSAQIAYIAGQPFANRCLRELGYMPFRIVSQPSDTVLVFMPEIESLQQDPQDPLDP